MWESDLVTFAKSKILLQTMSEIVHQDKLLYLGCICILQFGCSQRFIIKDKGHNHPRPGISGAGTSLDLRAVALSSALESQSSDYISALCDDCLGSETAEPGEMEEEAGLA